MVFRFWGDRHANVEQFEPLVDRRAGGIAETTLVDAITSRGWNAERIDGSIAAIRERTSAGNPLILLIEDRPSRYHYVVAVGADETHVFIHDPTWGPSRRLTHVELIRRWKPAGFWTLRVTPQGSPPLSPSPTPSTSPPARSAGDKSSPTCDRLLSEALDLIETRGSQAADDALDTVRRQCPEASGPLRELAGVRFAQKRWRDASALAGQAVKQDPNDAYAWDVLGSSRFMLDEPFGALEAWNRAGKPRLDSVEITGLTRARYAFVAQLTRLTTNQVLTAGQLALADRRLRELPDRVTTTVGYRPDADGFATVQLGIVERPQWPRSIVEWAALGTQAAVDREVIVAIPGGTGQGEVWSAEWRFWNQRPRVSAALSAPRVGRLAGVWQVAAAWEEQTYRRQDAADLQSRTREGQTHGSLSFANWVSANLRFEATAGIDVWMRDDEAGVGRRKRTLLAGGSVERRFADDRISLSSTARSWWPTDGGPSFGAIGIDASMRSNVEPARFGVIVAIRSDFASEQAPLAAWAGAGDDRTRPGLLRAHPLLHDGVIDGPVFGRRAQSATVELQHWFREPRIPRLGTAVFADAAHATDRLSPASGRRFQLDVGAGIRLRVPGAQRTIRIDYAHGLRDSRASTLTIGLDLRD